MKKVVIVFIIIFAIISITRIISINRSVFLKPEQLPTVAPEQLKIISTNPHPLDEATILPTQNIEFTFNKPLFRSQFKHKFDPDIEHEVEVIDGRDKEFGQTFKIVFKKPLELGLGYALFVFTNTKTEGGLFLDKEYVFHFQTIKYKGF